MVIVPAMVNNTNPDPLALRWGKLIKTHREDVLGETQVEFARRLQVGQASVSAWENGDRVPSRRVQGRLVEMLGLTKDDVYDLIRAGA